MHRFTFLAQFLAAAIALAALYWYARRRPLPTRPAAIAGILVLAALFEYLSFRASFPDELLWDFTRCYYAAGDAVLHHDTAGLKVLYTRVVQGFVNMPIVAWLFAPFALLRPGLAGAAYTVLGLGATLAAWHLLSRVARLQGRERWVLALLFLANGPLINTLKFGNTSHFILLALVAALVLLHAGRSATAGALLGAVAILKPAMLLFVVFFVLRRDLRGSLGFILTGIAISLASLAVFGWGLNQFWFQTSILQFGSQWFSAFSVQSVPGFILRLRADPQLMTSWDPVMRTAGEQLAAQVSVALLYLLTAAACLLGMNRSRAADVSPATRLDLQFLLVICLTIVSSPLSWSHYYCWLLVPAAFFLGPLAPAPNATLARVAGWVAIALVTPLVVWPLSLPQPALMTLYRSFAVSNLLLGGLLWFALVLWWTARPGTVRLSLHAAAQPEPG